MSTPPLPFEHSPLAVPSSTRKQRALEYAFSLEQTNASYETFKSEISPTVASHHFWGAAEDFYFTALTATISRQEPSLDPIAIAALNRTALQLEFQTRFLADGVPEALLYEGTPGYFYAAMANAHNIVGIHFNVGAALSPPPPWLNSSPHIEVNLDHLHAVDESRARSFLFDIKRKIGSLAIDISALQDQIDVHERYNFIHDLVSRHTLYLFFGSDETLEPAAQSLAKAYPQAQISQERYLFQRSDGLNSERFMLQVTGIEEIPTLRLAPAAPRRCRFIYAKNSNDPVLRAVSYRDAELITPTPPSHVIFSAPITSENLLKMTQDVQLDHEVVIIKDGLIGPDRSAIDTTYIHFSPSGDVVLDAGNEIERVRLTTSYQAGIDIEGVRHSTLPALARMKVDGPVMPLSFTPDVHRYFSHFLLQCFPRLLILDDLGLPDARILVPHDIFPKQLAMLHLAGIAPERILKIPPNTYVQASELIVPRAWPLVFSKFTASIYERLQQRVALNARKPKHRTLISRGSRRTWRNLTTYHAICSMLTTKHGFIEVRPEKLSLEDEIALYYDTAVLVGAEGAGLYSACYCQETTRVISLCDEDYMMPILATLATAHPFKLFHVFGESFRAPIDMSRRLPFGHSDFAIDPCDVETMLEIALAS